MIKNLYWLSWFAFLLSAFVMMIGSLILLKYGGNRGVLITYAGVAGFALSGFMIGVIGGG